MAAQVPVINGHQASVLIKVNILTARQGVMPCPSSISLIRSLVTPETTPEFHERGRFVTYDLSDDAAPKSWDMGIEGQARDPWAGEDFEAINHRSTGMKNWYELSTACDSSLGQSPTSQSTSATHWLPTVLIFMISAHPNTKLRMYS